MKQKILQDKKISQSLFIVLQTSCAACHAFILDMRVWGKLKRLCVLVD